MKRLSRYLLFGLRIPVGQSAHPLSPFYKDQQTYWVHGLTLLTFVPEH